MNKWIFQLFKCLFLLGSMQAISADVAQFPLTATYTIDKSWSGGYQISVYLKNDAGIDGASWVATFSLLDSQTIGSFWNGTYTASGQNITVHSPVTSYNAIPMGTTKKFGMTILNPQAGPKGITNLQAIANGTAPAIPVAPVLNAIPSDPSIPNGYTVSWNKVINGSSYILEQDTSPTFSTPQTLMETALSQSFVNQPNGTYYYRVAAANFAGTGPYSNTQMVVVPIQLQPPVLNTVVNPFGSGSYPISWSAISFAQLYTLQEASMSDFSDAQTIFIGAGTSFQVSGKAPNTYYYRVAAVDGSYTSVFSNPQTVVVTPTSAPIVESYWESWNSTSTASINAIVNMNVDVINIAFANFKTTGTHTYAIAGIDCSQTSLTQFITAVHQVGKKVKIAVGGETYPLGPQLQTVADAVGMAQAVAQFVQQNALDGVDFDIEDRPAAALEIALLQNTRQLLGNNALISYTPKSPASTTSPWNTVIQGAHQYMSYLMIMCYDYAPGYTYQADVANLLAMGVPASKIFVGLMPGYDDLHLMTSLADISAASSYILTNKLGGIMFWDLTLDHDNTTGLGVDAATTTAWNIIH